MADYMNMQQSEYDELQSSLTLVHENLLKEESAIRNKIRNLTQLDGGFYATMISAKIEALLLSVASGPVAHLQECYTDTEQAVAAYVAAVTEIDIIDQ